MAATSGTAEKAFWEWFGSKSSALLESKDWEGPLFNELHMQLEKVCAGLTYEIKLQGHEREIFISADGIRSRFSAVQSLVAAAPRFPGWKVSAFRQRHPLNLTFRMDGFELRPEDIRFTLSPGKDGKADVALFIRGYRPGSAELAQGAYIFLDAALGEYDMETKVGAVDMIPADTGSAPAMALPISELARVFDVFFGKGRSTV